VFYRLRFAVQSRRYRVIWYDYPNLALHYLSFKIHTYLMAYIPIKRPPIIIDGSPDHSYILLVSTKQVIPKRLTFGKLTSVGQPGPAAPDQQNGHIPSQQTPLIYQALPAQCSSTPPIHEPPAPQFPGSSKPSTRTRALRLFKEAKRRLQRKPAE
jgi:hypothetical protein